MISLAMSRFLFFILLTYLLRGFRAFAVYPFCFAVRPARLK